MDLGQLSTLQKSMDSMNGASKCNPPNQTKSVLEQQQRLVDI